MKKTLKEISREIARLLDLYDRYPNHPNRPKWVAKAKVYAGTLGNAFENDNDERLFDV